MSYIHFTQQIFKLHGLLNFEIRFFKIFWVICVFYDRFFPCRIYRESPESSIKNKHSFMSGNCALCHLNPLYII